LILPAMLLGSKLINLSYDSSREAC
jgi:hypothetical protein